MDKEENNSEFKIKTTITIDNSDSSLSFSLTPPSLGDEKKTNNEDENSGGSISDHLSSLATSIENDRSLQEIEIDALPILLLDSPFSEVQKISQETKPASLNTSDSVVSLGTLEYGEIKSILEEILSNEQFISESDTLSRKSIEDSFDIFAGLDLEDKSLTDRIMGQGNKDNIENILSVKDSSLDNVVKQVKDLEELLEIKDNTIMALTGELDSLKEFISNPSSASMGTSTDYKQLQEELPQHQFGEYQNVVEQKDDLILQLTESLQQSIANREELKNQVDHFKNELEHLQKQLKNTSKIVLNYEQKSSTPEVKIIEKNFKENSSGPAVCDANLEIECLKLEETLNIDQSSIFNNIRNLINKYIQDELDKYKKENEQIIKHLKDSIIDEKQKNEEEITELRKLAEIKVGSSDVTDLKQEMDSKHKKEMEDLRRYFEQKCADLEKNYSEEVFSQHSRKRSGSNSSSDNDLSPDSPSYQRHPGPGGDAHSSLETYQIDYKKRALHNLTKDDLEKLKYDLQNLFGIFQKYDLNYCSKEEIEQLKDQLGDYDVKNLFRIEMEAFRNEMKNKYNAELEILNQDYENRIDLLKIQQEEKLNLLRNKYLEEIENLKEILNKTNKSIGYTNVVQEVGNSGDYEINEVVQSYERRLQEQVALAKIDIIAALENQIQRLVADEGLVEEWPEELVTLKNRYTHKFEKQIEELKEEHQREITKLKEEHMKTLNGALERARRRSLKDGESFTNFDAKIIDERDYFKKRAHLLRSLLGELLKYFTQCEDEVNNTIVDELVRHAAEKNLTDIERELNDSTSSSKSDSPTRVPTVKRVHLAPNIKDLMVILEKSSEKDTESVEFSEDLKNELEACLEKLKFEANAVLALSFNVSKKFEADQEKNKIDDNAIGSLNRKLIEEVQTRMRLSEEVEELRNIVDSLDKERSVLEGQVVELVDRLNVTEGNFEKAQMKISNLLESGQREIISEGYGGHGFQGEREEGQAVTDFNKLQERARSLLVGGRTHDSTLLHVIEELVTVGERIIEEEKSERKDLQQQIDVADKKYKQTCKFLEEQAVDREMERDDYQKQILALQDHLKNSDKDRASFANINEEVENLETQLKESIKSQDEKDQKLKEIELEKDEAVEKIYFLREVIRELETQIKTKAETEAELRNIVSELECIISQQNKGIGIGLEKLDGNFECSDNQELTEHLKNLEAEVQQLRLSQELVGSEGALREVRNQLFEIENIIDKKTKELEEQSSPVSTTACSSPSEDMSVKDVIRPKTPNNVVVNDCEIPLQQLARLKDKLIRHARAEDAALKRIRDLEMQVYNLKGSVEEYHTERDILKKEIADQLVLISSLQIRLDDQRIRAEHIEKQTNSSLESRIYDLQKEMADLQELLQNRNTTIGQLNAIIGDMRKKIEERDSELSASSDDEMIITMQKEIEHLRNQNELLHKRLNSGVDIIPNLVENIISDKNSDIESLRQKLETTERQLEMYNSLSLDKSQLSALKNLRSSGTSLSEVLSIIELSSPEQMRRMADQSYDGHSFLNKKPTKKNDTTFLTAEDDREISSIEKLGPSNELFLSVTPSGTKNSASRTRSTDKRVHFDLSDENNAKIQNFIAEIEKLKLVLAKKDEVIENCNERLQILNQLESNIDMVQGKLEETQNTLKDVTEKFEKELAQREEAEKELKIEIVQKKVVLEEQEEEIQLLKDDASRKDDMYINLMRETKELKKEKEILESKVREYKDVEDIMSVKNNIILELEQQLGELRNRNLDSNNFEERLRENEDECESLKLKIDSFSRENEQKDQLIEKLELDKNNLIKAVKNETENNEKMKKNVENKDKQIEEYEEELKKLRVQLQILNSEKNNLSEELDIQKDIVSMKERELNNMLEMEKIKSDNLKKLESEVNLLSNITVNDLKNQLEEVQRENAMKKAELQELHSEVKKYNDEIALLQNALSEKDKVISQFKKDSEHLQMNLETIQNKMKENGNIIDLGRKLRDEQRKNSELLQEIQLMKAQMMSYGIPDKDVMVTSLEEITNKVKEELDYSAQLDSNIISATEDIESAEELENTLSKLKKKHNNLQKKFAELQTQLEKKDVEINSVQLEDARLIEQLRIQLESATENEFELVKIVETWKKQCEILEIEIAKLRAQLSNVNSKTESTEYKKLPSKESQEVVGLKKQLSDLTGELELQKDEIRKLKKERRELETNFRYEKDMLALKKKEMAKLEKKLGDAAEREGSLREKYSLCNEELQKRTKEVENSRILMDDMDHELKELRNQIKISDDKLRKLEENVKTSVPYHSKTNIPIADQLMNKIEEMNSTVKNDRRTMDLILRLTNDNKLLKNRILELETEGTTNVPFENPMNRANYLFAKCLRIDSYRKALIWQKQYLINLIGSYQVTTDLGPMEKLQGSKKIRFSGIRKFRCVAYSIVAILRMKFIVRRWHTGARLAENVNLRYRNVSASDSQSVIRDFPSGPANFQVGQPVSRQQFAQPSGRSSLYRANATSDEFGHVLTDSGSRLNAKARTDMPWSGVSPPSKEKSAARPRVSSSLASLKAPQLLNQYAERFNKIQENFEILLNPDNPT